MAIKPIPAGYHSITPSIMVRDAAKAIEFYKKAFNAEEVERFKGPDGKIMHASLKIGDSMLMLGEENRERGCLSPASLGGHGCTLFLYVENADAVFNRAVSAGCKVEMPLGDQFWGDRAGTISDPSGHFWMIATRKEELTHQQIVERAREFFAAMATR